MTLKEIRYNDALPAGRRLGSAVMEDMEEGLKGAFIKSTDGVPVEAVSSFPIVGEGDSLTQGVDLTSPNTEAWIVLLAQLFGTTASNLGASGTYSDEISARQGGTPMTGTVSGGSIPASGSVNITGLTPDGIRGGAVSSIPVIIEGVPGTLARVSTNRVFTRTAPGSAVSVPNVVDIYSDAPSLRGDRVLIAGAGTNDLPAIVAGTRTVDYVCAQFANMAEVLTPVRPRFLFWGPLDRGASEGAGTTVGGHIRSIEQYLARTFGAKFVNVREYLSTRGLADAGITPTSDDIADMAVGGVPRSLRTGSTTPHLTATGHYLIAKLFARTIVRLGWGTIVGTITPPSSIPLLTGSSREWNARSHAVGGTVAPWPDLRGGASLINAGGSAQPTVMEESGSKFVRFDGVDDLVADTSFVGTQPHTRVVRFRWVVAPSGSKTVVGSTGTGTAGNTFGTVSASNNYQANAGTPLVASPAIAPDTGWHTAIIVFNGATSVLSIDGVETVGNAGAQTGGGIRLGAASGTTPTVFSNIDYKRLAVLPYAADSAQRAAILAAFAD